MRILVVCQYYYPEPFRITDLCEALAGAGHEVTVLTGRPNYPMGKIYDGYRGRKTKRQVINGVSVRRCFTIGRRTGTLFRMLNYFSYAISSTLYASFLREEYDQVLVYQLSPVMMAWAGMKYARGHRKKLILFCQDLWPASLSAWNVKDGSLLYRVFHRISRRVYRAADWVLISSKLFRDYLEREFGVPDDRITYLPQYAEELFESVEDPAREKGETVDLVFAGNIGALQRVDTIIRAAGRLKEQKNIRWHIVGDGSELESCRALVRQLGLQSVVFHGRKPVFSMPEYYGMADAMLVTMAPDPLLSLTLPGKVQSYMAAGKPILGAVDGETRLVISEAACGYCCSAGDDKGLAELVTRFVAEGQKDRLGANARTYYQEHFSKTGFMRRLLKILADETGR